MTKADSDARTDFRQMMGPVAEALLGAPNKEMSTRSELRFRRKGSLKVDLASGTWIDFECNEGGGVLDLIERELGLRGRDAIDWLRREGIAEREPLRVIEGGRSAPDAAARTTWALRIWRECRPAAGTPVETYLRSRGITVPPPPTLRFHPRLQHRKIVEGQPPIITHWPAMVAAVTRGAERIPVAIHRTYLAPDGGGKAPVNPNKMELGPCHGGAVRLAPAGETLSVGEGIETCLSVMTAIPTVAAWAALSTSGLRSLDLPPAVREVTVLADGDAPGEAAAQAAGMRWMGEGRRVRIARPPPGCDFNDLLVASREAAS